MVQHTKTLTAPKPNSQSWMQLASQTCIILTRHSVFACACPWLCTGTSRTISNQLEVQSLHQLLVKTPILDFTAFLISRWDGGPRSHFMQCALLPQIPHLGVQPQTDGAASCSSVFLLTCIHHERNPVFLSPPEDFCQLIVDSVECSLLPV